MRNASRRLLAASVALAAASVVLTTAAGALGGPPPKWRTFGDADWRPHMGYNSQHGLVTSSACPVYPNCFSDGTFTYGGIELLNGPTDPSAISAASFWFKPSATGGSGGSPRLVFLTSDGGKMELRPLAWASGVWTLEDGFNGPTATDWDNGGGSCGFLYEQTYAVVSACHTGASITAIFLVNDSGWLYPPGETVVVDDITVNSIVASGPGNST